MSDGLLESIIQLEKSIQEEIARERVRAEEWQARELAHLESTFTKIKEEITERHNQQMARKKRDLQAEGAKIQSDAERWCKRLESLDDSLLRGTLRSHLTVILPEGDHDHPHGEG